MVARVWSDDARGAIPGLVLCLLLSVQAAVSNRGRRGRPQALV